MRKGHDIGILALAVIFAVALAASVAPPAQSQSGSDLNRLSFGVLMVPSLVDWFNRTARPDDIALVGPRDVGILDQIHVGRKEVMFISVAAASRQLPAIADKVDMISFGLESGPLGPSDEKSNPVAAAQSLKQLANTHQLATDWGPDRTFLSKYGGQMAPYFDQVVMQLQAMQKIEPQNLVAYGRAQSAILRSANPNIKVWAQLGTTQGVEPMLEYTRGLGDAVDGIVIISLPASSPDIETIQGFVSRLRSGEAVPPTTPAPVTPTPTRITTATATQTVPALTPSPTTKPGVTPSPTQGVTPTRTRTTSGGTPSPTRIAAGPTLSPTPKTGSGAITPQPSTPTVPPTQCVLPGGFMLVAVAMFMYSGLRQSRRKN